MTSAMDGLVSAWEETVSVNQTAVIDQIDSIYSQTEAIQSSIGDIASTVFSTVVEYLQGTFPTFQKYDLGGICVTSEDGLWYLLPTDCDAFSEMGNIFTDLPNAETHFNRAVAKLSACTMKTGLGDFPTPFLNLQGASFCLPQFMVTSMEYVLGAIIYSGNVMSQIASDISTVGDMLIEFAQTKVGISQALLQRDTKEGAGGGLWSRRKLEAYHQRGQRNRALFFWV